MLSLVRPPSDVAVIGTAPETPGCASHAKSWVLAATILGSSAVFVEGSVINVALPAIQEGLHTTVGDVQWIGSVFTLLLATLTLVAGSAGDRFGRRRLFIVGLGVLSLGSVLAGVAASSVELILARAVQGLGGALLVPNSLSLLSAGFPRAERGQAIGTWSAFTALTGAAGPIVGGVLVDSVSWRAAFLLVVPLALVTMGVALLRVPDVRIVKHRPEIDWWGALLATAGLTALVFGVIRSRDGAVALAMIAAGVVLLALLFVYESRAAHPMMPPRLFRSRTFLGANLLTLLLYFALTAAFFVLPFYLVRVLGYSATATGASYLPFALIMGFLSRWSGGLADRYGARLPLIAGPLVAALGMALFARAAGGSYWIDLFPPMALTGLGMAITVAPLTTTVLASVDEADTGVASGVNNTIARVAALLAVAVAGILALDVFAHALAAGLATLDLSPVLRAALDAAERSFGDVPVPPVATPLERAAVMSVVADALATSFRWTVLASAAVAVGAAGLAALLIEASPARAASDVTAQSCAHLEDAADVVPQSAGCEECLRAGMRWVHLRVCLACGHVGCCDSSRGRHATAHFWATEHPVVRSLEKGETWRWCYVDDLAC